MVNTPINGPPARDRGAHAYVIQWVIAMACAALVPASIASDAEDYLRRAAQRDLTTFDALDRDKDGNLTVEEVHGSIDLEARFNDLDINRDGVITRQELTRYIALQYGVAALPAS